jgi:hypothetical protein
VIRKEHRLSRLLSGRPGLSRPEKEEILDAVLVASAEPEPAAQRHGWLGVFAALAVGAAAVLIFTMPAPPPEPESFTARGRVTGPQLTAVCAATDVAGACSTGGELLFELADASAFTHVALFAFREDGTAIWYAPDETGHSLAIERGVAMALLPRRVTLGPEHTPGPYTVAAVLSTRPLQRAEVREIYEHPESHRDARVVETEVEIR